MKIVRVPGSCGELVQGMDSEEQLFLITCPIDLYASATITAEKWRNPYKIAKARRLTMEYLHRKKWLNIKVESQLLKGKGMASSSADVVAVIRLVAWELGCELTDTEIGAIATKIEPTDGIFCPGIVKYAYREGRIIESLGDPPLMKIVVFDGGGTINTLRFNRQDKVDKYYASHKEDIIKAATLVKKGIETKDPLAIGKGATLSGYINQGLLYKEALEDLIFISEKYGAVGVNVAHSGTVMGILFPQNVEAMQRQACVDEVLDTCLNIKCLGEVNLIGGGIEREER